MNFEKNRKVLETEFEKARFDKSSGLSPEQLKKDMLEMYSKRGDLSEPLIRAKIYEYLLDNLQIEINPLTPFPFKINLGIPYPKNDWAGSDVYHDCFYYQKRHEIEKRIFSETDFQKLDMMGRIGMGFACTDFWHTVPDWNNVLKLGFTGMLQNARNSKEKFKPDSDESIKRIEFLDSVIICFEAILRLLGRLYEKSLEYDIPDASKALKNLTENPPQNIYEVMMLSILFLYVEEIGPDRGRSLGNIDNLWYPYYKNDLESGRYTKEEIEELFKFFFIHFVAKRRNAQQPLCLCGADENGNTYATELTYLILDIYDSLKIYDPKIHIRFHDGIDDKIMLKVLDMIRRGNSSICILNDNAVISGYERLGIPKTNAVKYIPLGCYEPIIMGMEEAEIGASWFNISKPLEYAINGGKDILSGFDFGLHTPDDFDDFDSFFDAYINQLDYSMEFIINAIEKSGEYSTEVNPSPIYSATFTKCLEKGMDVHEWPLEYNNISVKCFALATAVDSLYMIKKYVFDRKELTFSEMKSIILNNWSGNEELRQKILADKEKYGNNLTAPDEIMKKITQHLGEKYVGRKLKRNGVLRLGTDSITYCLQYGKTSAASFNGRLAREPLSKNLAATSGMDRNGITALMQSVLKINSADFIDSAVLDFVLHPSAVNGEKGLLDFYSLIKVFFSQGGFAIQGNIVNGDMLKEAQNTPEKYSTLQVRVCGWNEYFVKMERDKQDMFIRQFEDR